MSFDKKRDILIDIFGPSYKTQNKEILFHCPFCHHHKQKFSVNISKGCWRCWICGEYGAKLYWLVKKFGDSTQKANWRRFAGIIDQSEVIFSLFEETVEEKTIIHLPDSFRSLVRNDLSRFDMKPLNYLLSRGIDKQDIIWWKMGYCSDGDFSRRIIIPSFDMNGDVNYFAARTYEEGPRPYVYPTASHNFVFNELYINWNEPITLVEGVFDAIKCKNSIPILGSSLGENSYLLKRLVEEANEVYLGLDPDAAVPYKVGQKSKEQKLAELLMKYGLGVYKLRIEGHKDLGEMTKQQVEQLKLNPIHITPDYFLTQLFESIS